MLKNIATFIWRRVCIFVNLSVNINNYFTLTSKGIEIIQLIIERWRQLLPSIFEEINSEQFKEVAILAGIDNVRIIDVDDISINISFIRHYGSINYLMIYRPNLLLPLPYDNYIYEIKKTYVPNKNIYINLKIKDKDKLAIFYEG